MHCVYVCSIQYAIIYYISLPLEHNLKKQKNKTLEKTQIVINLCHCGSKKKDHNHVDDQGAIMWDVNCGKTDRAP